MEIIKVGGSVITDKGGFERARPHAIAFIAAEIAKRQKKGKGYAVVLGAGSFAHPHVLRYGLHGKNQSAKRLEGVRHINRSVSALASMFARALEANGVKAKFLPACVFGRATKGRLDYFDAHRALEAVRLKIVPITIGDMVPDSALGFSAISGDQIVRCLGAGAKRAVLLSDVPGVLVGGKVVALITKKSIGKITDYLGGSEKTDVTGGMEGKVRQLLEMPVPSVIVGMENFGKVLDGKKAVCTRIMP